MTKQARFTIHQFNEMFPAGGRFKVPFQAFIRVATQRL